MEKNIRIINISGKDITLTFGKDNIFFPCVAELLIFCDEVIQEIIYLEKTDIPLTKKQWYRYEIIPSEFNIFEESEEEKIYLVSKKTAMMLKEYMFEEFEHINFAYISETNSICLI